MYAPFFGLKQAPFSIAPDPHYLFMSERHREALAHLLYGLDGGGGFVLLTGEIGAGKTTVCRCFLEQIPANCNVAYIFNPKLTVPELLQAICDEFHVPVPAGALTVKDYVDPLNAFLLAQHAAGRNNVLIIDEAQNLSADVLEQLRLLTNLETTERKLLQVVLIGQPELRGMLARPELEQLAQRVIARFHLGALSEAETAQYIRHRLTVAGLTGALPFDRAALRLIHQLTRGVPRRINLLCDRALLGGYAGGQALITPAIVRQAAAEVFDAQRPAARRRRRPDPIGISLVVLAAAMAGAGLTWALQRPSPGRGGAAGAAVATAASAASSPASAASAVTLAASAASQPASAAGRAGPPEAQPLQLADWTPRDDDAWAALAKAWGLPLPAQADPCAVAAQRGLQCYRSTSGSLSVIRLIDRPVLLTLRRPGQPPALAALVGLDGQQATLWVDGAPRRVELQELAGAWRGEFATFWRVPPGYASRADNSGPLRGWLAAQLARVPGLAAPGAAASAPPSWPELSRQVQAFQASQGLQPDGRVGPITLMLVNRVAGVAEPKLDPTTD
ncbi:MULTISPECIES: ExeA family protein [Roseateles]|uniref:General secretion pathway protein A n=1 Tax=Pelomonas aquatica TaxID=431058 RepID=A0ABU1ZGJ7_9BURK|nr:MULTISPECIES: ExeA family protein [Roseateles]KQY85630.1 peptidoglycan-binding protein [Pelomonas sp. Root1444]MDR7298776.1 general secretion pathway protein A [Pelomonas aquatica]